MNALIVGASGATGRLLVEQLLNRGVHVKIIIRSVASLPETITNNKNTTVVCASILDLSDSEMARHVQGCQAVASCLGHNMTLKGLYGHPRRLVTEATRRLCNGIQANHPVEPVKYLLMNTAGNSNRDLKEPISVVQKCIILLLRLLLPPHSDNEKAADFLRTEIGHEEGGIEWVAIRPDGLVNESGVSEYELHPSPTRSALFAPGTTSRINVAHFMAELITDNTVWERWKGQMPVIYNKY